MGKGRYIILIGNYGSGKTEIALNIAIRAAARGERTQVIDLDKVNDYFRMSDRVELLEQNKIDVVAPTGLRKGAVQANVRSYRPFAQQRPGHPADPHGPRRMGTGWANHDRPQDLKNVQHFHPSCLFLL